MACLACMGACSEAFYKVFDPDKACLQIVEKKAVRPIACPQCGKCAEACPEGAITQNPKGVYMINKKKCTGCGACAKACPFGLIVKTEGNPASKCIACGICQMNCPNGTIKVLSSKITTEDGKTKRVLDKYMYDLGSCTFCQLCVITCPHDALEFVPDFEHPVFTREKLVKQLNHTTEATVENK